jgi:hypothetical protein
MMDERRDGNHVELVSEMMARYLDEWIFFEVVEDDEYERPHKGRLIAHSPDRDEIHRIVMERKDAYHIAVWYTGQLVPEGDLVLL